MKTLIYVCYVALFTTPVKQECHLEEISHPPQAVYQWCSELVAIPSGGKLAVSQCHEYRPGEELQKHEYIRAPRYKK
jgi:hypothetical protein